MRNSLVQYVLQHMSVQTNVCSLQKFETGYTLAPRTVSDYNLIQVSRGHVVWVIDTIKFDLRPGDFVIVPPGVGHHGYSATRNITLTSIHVEVRLPGGQDVFTLLNPPRFQHAPLNGRLSGYFQGATREFARTEEGDAHLMLRGWVHLLIRELFIQNDKAGLLRPGVGDPVVMRVLDELNRYSRRPVQLSELAARSGFSPQHLNRVFQKALGMTPLQYLNKMKMERAAAQLREGRLTVNAIGKGLGLEDPYYFSRIFRQQFGLSPVQYRAAVSSDSPSRGSAGPFTK